MKGSMHKMINGYGAGAVPLRQLEADGAAERGSSSRFDTNYTRQFVAHADNPSMHDHRRHRNTQKYPREANLTLSSTALGRLTGPFKGTLGLGQDPLASSFQRADPRMKRIREGGPRPENYGLSSGDVGNWRKAERPSQQHQEDPRIRQKDPDLLCAFSFMNSVQYCRPRPLRPFQGAQRSPPEPLAPRRLPRLGCRPYMIK